MSIHNIIHAKRESEDTTELEIIITYLKTVTSEMMSNAEESLSSAALTDEGSKISDTGVGVGFYCDDLDYTEGQDLVFYVTSYAVSAILGTTQYVNGDDTPLPKYNISYYKDKDSGKCALTRIGYEDADAAEDGYNAAVSAISDSGYDLMKGILSSETFEWFTYDVTGYYFYPLNALMYTSTSTETLNIYCDYGTDYCSGVIVKYNIDSGTWTYLCRANITGTTRTPILQDTFTLTLSSDSELTLALMEGSGSYLLGNTDVEYESDSDYIPYFYLGDDTDTIYNSYQGVSGYYWELGGSSSNSVVLSSGTTITFIAPSFTKSAISSSTLYELITKVGKLPTIYTSTDFDELETDFSGMFTLPSLTEVADDLFDNNTQITTLDTCFLGCSSLTSVSDTLFDNLTSLSSISYMFSETGITTFGATFFDCPITDATGLFASSSLSDWIQPLFNYLITDSDFSYLMYECDLSDYSGTPIFSVDDMGSYSMVTGFSAAEEDDHQSILLVFDYMFAWATLGDTLPVVISMEDAQVLATAYNSLICASPCGMFSGCLSQIYDTSSLSGSYLTFSSEPDESWRYLVAPYLTNYSFTVATPISEAIFTEFLTSLSDSVNASLAIKTLSALDYYTLLSLESDTPPIVRYYLDGEYVDADYYLLESYDDTTDYGADEYTSTVFYSYDPEDITTVESIIAEVIVPHLD